MKKYSCFLFILLLAASLYSQEKLVSPFQSGAYVPGIMNIRAYENPTEGNFLMIFDDNVFAFSKGFNDRHGNFVNEVELGGDYGIVPLDTDVNSYMNFFSINYISNPVDFLGGAKIQVAVKPNFTYSNLFFKLGISLTDELEFSKSVGGFGDLTVMPFNLMYSFSESFDFSIGYSFVAPTGRYQTGAGNNIGNGYWSHIVQAVGYVFLDDDKSLVLMVSPSGEFHGKIKDADVTPGDRFNIEYGASQYLSENFEVFLQGGHTMQVSGDEGEDVHWDTSYYDRLNNFGVGVGYWPIPLKFYLNAKWYETYSNRQHFDADFFQLQLLYIL